VRDRFSLGLWTSSPKKAAIIAAASTSVAGLTGSSCTTGDSSREVCRSGAGDAGVDEFTWCWCLERVERFDGAQCSNAMAEHTRIRRRRAQAERLLRCDLLFIAW